MAQEEFFADLKQYITAENSALKKRLEASIDQKLEEKLEEKLNQKFDEKLAPIHQKIDDLAAFMQDAHATSNEIN
jgi:predicted house-cleaning noncanonical NTP pyrophosphatase (MazG superfamily)